MCRHTTISQVNQNDKLISKSIKRFVPCDWEAIASDAAEKENSPAK